MEKYIITLTRDGAKNKRPRLKLLRKGSRVRTWSSEEVDAESKSAQNRPTVTQRPSELPHVLSEGHGCIWPLSLFPDEGAISGTMYSKVLCSSWCPGGQSFCICLFLCSTRWKDSNLLMSTDVRKLEGAEIILFCSAAPATPVRGEHILFPTHWTSPRFEYSTSHICIQAPFLWGHWWASDTEQRSKVGVVSSGASRASRWPDQEADPARFNGWKCRDDTKTANSAC